MRILAINQFYLPDKSASSQLLGDLCEGLAASGEELEVIASRGTYLGGQTLPRRELRAGVCIHRPWATSWGKASRAHRMGDYLSFWASAINAASTTQRPDVIIALTTPPMIAAGAAAVAAARGIPLVTWVHDVYPEIAAAFGVLSARSTPYRLLRRLATATHARTRRIVTLSSGMALRLRSQGAPEDRIRVIPNWADGELIRPVERAENRFRATHALGDKFVAMYSGNLGEGHDVATLVQAAALLAQEDPEVLVLFVGSGARESEARKLSANLPNVRFLPYQPREDLAQSLSAADIHLISLRAGLDGLLVPSKLYGALASGRPVFFVGPRECEVARVVNEAGVGWQGLPGQARELADAIVRTRRSPEHWRSTGAKARALFEANYDKSIAVSRWGAVLEEARSSR